MNSIEKLAIKHGAFLHVDERANDDVTTSIEFLPYEPEAFAKALQSSEPVAEVVEDTDNPYSLDAQGNIRIGLKLLFDTSKLRKGDKLFTIPPSTVPLEEHNKRIAELEAKITQHSDNLDLHMINCGNLQATNKTLLDALLKTRTQTSDLHDGEYKTSLMQRLITIRALVDTAIAEAEGVKG